MRNSPFFTGNSLLLASHVLVCRMHVRVHSPELFTKSHSRRVAEYTPRAEKYETSSRPFAEHAFVFQLSNNRTRDAVRKRKRNTVIAVSGDGWISE